jgi:hypothetical protein
MGAHGVSKGWHINIFGQKGPKDYTIVRDE